MNGLMIDSDNVLLLTNLNPTRGPLVLPAVDLVNEPKGAQGMAVAQIFPFVPNALERLVQQAGKAFTAYRSAGAKEAAVMVTLDVPNNFPQLPVRTDGPFLVWLGLFADERTMAAEFSSLSAEWAEALQASGLLRATPETLVLKPAQRSRLRWC
jgi:hypothetical protein